MSITTGGQYDAGISTNTEWAIAVHFDDADELLMNDCYIRGAAQNSTYATRTTSIGVKYNTCTGMRIINSGIFLVGKGVEVTGQSEGGIFQGMTVVGVTSGFHFYDLVLPANNHTICDTHVSAYHRGIDFSQVGDVANFAQSNYINSCFIFEREPSASKPDWIGINFWTRYSTISDCTIQSNTTSTTNTTAIRLLTFQNIVSNIITFNQAVPIFAIAYGGLTARLSNIWSAGSLIPVAMVAGDASSTTSVGVDSGDNQLTLQHRASLHRFSSTGGTSLVELGLTALFPSSDNTYALGSSTRSWSNVYGANFRPGNRTAIWTSGTGSPEGVLTAVVGSLYTRLDGGVNTTLYVKQSGTGNTGWAAK